MKFDCGPSRAERYEVWLQRKAAKEKWHRWFAWRPVTVKSYDCRWLEYVERSGTFFYGRQSNWWEWEHRKLRDDG